ncbi:ABC transporter permease subunit [Micromonospora sp. BRA006-A]|nr:ABC transporter permease subunit [Micromonospora sp. BRA006-A]
MTNPDTFIVLVTVEAVWKDVGWGTIVFLAALSTIDQNLYEAAAADGAGRWRRLWHITLPGLRPVIVLLLILRLGDALGRLRAVPAATRRRRPAGRRGARHLRLPLLHRHRELRLRRGGRTVQGRHRAGADPGREPRGAHARRTRDLPKS